MREVRLPKVLWIDDEHGALKSLISQAKMNDIDLVPFKSLQAGLAELEQNYDDYEAVLLDAKFTRADNDDSRMADTEYAFRAKERIIALSRVKLFEIFVLTGKYEDGSTIDSSFRKAFKNVYRKGMAADNERLFADLQAAIDNQLSYQIRQEFGVAFDACATYLQRNSESILLGLLTRYKKGQLEISDLNNIRKVLEALQEKIVESKILPPQVSSLKRIADFLAGGVVSLPFGMDKKKRNQKIARDAFPLAVGKLLVSLTETVHAGSHNGYFETYLHKTPSNYWLVAAVYQLTALLEYFKLYFDDRPGPLDIVAA